jgi:hypothetical protein
MLRVDAPYARRKLLMLNATKFEDDAEQTCWAILTYAVYMTTNAHRGKPRTIRTAEEAAQEVMQQVRHGVEGHVRATRVLGCRWVR